MVTLGDDSAKQTIVLESLGGQSVEQVSPLARGTAVQRFARGNVSGDVVFSSSKSHATRAAAASAWKSEYGRLNEVGTLVLTIDATTLTYAGAVLRSVVGIPDGVRWTLRYTFGVTTVS